jgi:hypothetical protein
MSDHDNTDNNLTVKSSERKSNNKLLRKSSTWKRLRDN